MSNLSMPKIDRKLIARKEDIIKDLKKIVKVENILSHEDELKPFETDALSAYKQKPLLVIFPENTNEVSKVLSYCNKHKMPEQHKCTFDWSIKSETFVIENKCVAKKVPDI